MEKIIEKATEGGYGLIDKEQNKYQFPSTQQQVILDPLFWIALAKNCGWNMNEEYDDNTQDYLHPEYIQIASRFYIKNLTESFDKAVDYLLEITNCK